MTLRERRHSDIDDRLAHPIDEEEEDDGSSRRRHWDGRRWHTREYLEAAVCRDVPGMYRRAVEHDGRCVGTPRK